MRGNGDDSSSRAGSRLGWVLRFGTAAVAVFFVANFAVVAAEDRLPNPRRYLSPRTEQLVGDMDRLQAAGVRADMVFAGTSQAARGIVPKVVRDELGLRWTGNVAIPGSQAPVTERWLLEEVVPRLRPRCVVWGLSSIDLNGARPDPSLPRYNAALATRRGLLGEADERLADLVPVARHRSQLRDPYVLGSQLRTVERTRAERRALEELLGPVIRPPASERAKRTEAIFLRNTLLANFEMTPQYRNALRSTIRSLRDQGIEPAIVLMPISRVYLDSHPRGEQQYETWKRATMRVAEDAGARVIDMDRSMPEDAFSDYVHLTPAAAREWSAMLARELAPMDCGSTR